MLKGKPDEALLGRRDPAYTRPTRSRRALRTLRISSRNQRSIHAADGYAESAK